jgi:hypothetical protein
MNKYTFERAIIARLRQQKCIYMEAESTSVSMLFKHPKGKFHFIYQDQLMTRDGIWNNLILSLLY